VQHSFIAVDQAAGTGVHRDGGGGRSVAVDEREAGLEAHRLQVGRTIGRRDAARSPDVERVYRIFTGGKTAEKFIAAAAVGGSAVVERIRKIAICADTETIGDIVERHEHKGVRRDRSLR